MLSFSRRAHLPYAYLETVALHTPKIRTRLASLYASIFHAHNSGNYGCAYAQLAHILSFFLRARLPYS
jgi:hypothetical protein